MIWDEMFETNRRGMGSSNQCYTVMYAAAKAFNIKKMVEIGTHRALSTISFAGGIQSNGYIPEIHTVDNFKMYTDKRFEGIKKETIANIEGAGFSDNIILYDGDSIEVLPEIFKAIGKVDMCFIDGDHSVEGVLNDFCICEPYTDLILFHDTLEGKRPYFGVVRDHGYSIISFPTRYIEGDGHSVGISIAQRL